MAAFDGTSAHIVDFLSGEVLAGYPPELQRFMLHTSVLERLCAPLCDALLDGGASAGALESLARSNLFLIPLDDRREWFRFHHLFAQILRLELERREPGGAPELHRRAYEWHTASGTADEAIHHALAARAHPEAAELIAETWVHYANAGRTQSVLEWLGRYPDELLRDDARLLVVQAWVLALRGREADMRAAVARARELGGLDAGPLPDGFASLESSLALLGATFAWGDVSAVREHGARWSELEPHDSPWRPVLTWALGWAHYCDGDLDGAERWLRETTEIAPPADQWIVGDRGDRRPVADRRPARTARRPAAAGRRGGRGGARARADRRDRGRRGPHRARRLARGRGPARAGAAGPRAGRLPAPPLGAAARPHRRARLARADGRRARRPARARRRCSPRPRRSLAACRDPGALPARVAAARRALGSDNGTAELSERELTILRFLTSGLSEREIGRELYLSFNTVHSHVKSVYRKLGVSSRAEAVERARSERLLT